MEVTKTCSVFGCMNTYKDHKWGVIKAQQEGWFFQKDGQVFCPSHVPDWVVSWRKNRNT